MKNNNNKNNKHTLVTKLVEENKCTKYEARYWIRAINRAMTSLLKNNHRVYLKNLITIKCVKAKGKSFTHRTTKEKILLPERMKPKAFFSKKIKEIVKKNLSIENLSERK
jgi:nucleoid DNA-binding protein